MKKVILLAVAMVMAFCIGIGSTLAYIFVDTDPVVNTFTYGDINITLDEADVNDEDNDGNTTERVKAQSEYKMIPGITLSKDPTVTVKANSEACWLFIKLEKTNNPDNFLSYSVDPSIWTPLNGYDGVYYKEVPAVTTDTPYTVLTGNQVAVKDSVTKEMLNALDKDQDGNALQTPIYPKLTFTAYAVQKENVGSAAAAWAIANPTT